MYSKHRLEAISDGIFAVAMTLLVLEIKLPADKIPPGQFAHTVAQNGPYWIAFAITFLLSARYWALQHRLFDLLEHIKPRTLVTTFFFLGLITILPYTTALWGRSISERPAFCLYFAHQFAVGSAILLEIELGLRDHNLHMVEEMHELRGRLYTMITVMAAAAIAAWFVPIRYVGFIAIIITPITRRLRKHLAQRRTAAKATAIP